MSFTDEEVKRIMRAALTFRALEEIGSQEIQVLQGTRWNKGKVKVKLREVRNLLDREYNKDVVDHNVVDGARLKELRAREGELLSIGEDGFTKDTLDMGDGKESVAVDVPVKDLLKKVRAEREEILDGDNEAYGAYHAILGLIEKLSLKLTTLDLEQVIELDLILDEYFKGGIKFIEE